MRQIKSTSIVDSIKEEMEMKLRDDLMPNKKFSRKITITLNDWRTKSHFTKFNATRVRTFCFVQSNFERRGENKNQACIQTNIKVDKL